MSKTSRPCGTSSVCCRRRRCRAATSTPTQKFRNTKTRLHADGGVAHPRDTCGYRCGVRLALDANPSFSSCSEISVPAHQPRPRDLALRRRGAWAWTSYGLATASVPLAEGPVVAVRRAFSVCLSAGAAAAVKYSGSFLALCLAALAAGGSVVLPLAVRCPAAPAACLEPVRTVGSFSSARRSFSSLLADNAACLAAASVCAFWAGVRGSLTSRVLPPGHATWL